MLVVVRVSGVECGLWPRLRLRLVKPSGSGRPEVGSGHLDHLSIGLVWISLNIGMVS